MDISGLSAINGLTSLTGASNLSKLSDKEITDIYSASQREGLIKSIQIEQELIEFEHNLWEF